MTSSPCDTPDSAPKFELKPTPSYPIRLKIRKNIRSIVLLAILDLRGRMHGCTDDAQHFSLNLGISSSLRTSKLGLSLSLREREPYGTIGRLWYRTYVPCYTLCRSTILTLVTAPTQTSNGGKAKERPSVRRYIW